MEKTDPLRFGIAALEARRRAFTADDVVACAPADTVTPFTDNMTGTCSACGAAVIFRPYCAPARKLCMTCVGVMIEKDRKGLAS